MDLPSTGSASPSPRDVGPRRKVGRMYALQVRAFIEATEVVDADPDTIEDILDGFDEDEDQDVSVDDDENDVVILTATQVKSEEHEIPDDKDDEDDEEDASFAQYLAEGETSMQIYLVYRLTYVYILASADKAWTKEEVKAMMKDLKEHGESLASHSTGCILTC